MKKKMLTACIVFFLYCAGLAHISAESNATVLGSTGFDLVLPATSKPKIPAVRLRVALPLELYSDTELTWGELRDEVRGGIRLNWGSRFGLYAGNLSFSGSVSLLKSPEFSLSLSPLGKFGFSSAGIAMSFPSYSGSRQALAVVASARLGSGGGILLQAAATCDELYTASVVVPLKIGGLKLSCVTVAGMYRLPSTLLDAEDSWFARDLPYAEGYSFAAVEDVRITGSRCQGQVAAGVFVSPFGEASIWGRGRIAFDVGLVSVICGIYGGDCEIVSVSASRVRSTSQVFVNPQVTIPLSSTERKELRLGLLFATDGRNTSGKAPEFLVDGRGKIGAELFTPQMRLRLDGGFQGISLYGEAPDSASKAEEKYFADAEFVFRKLPFSTTLTVDGGASAYPKDGNMFNKTELSFGVAVYPGIRRKGGLFALIPSVVAGLDLSFLKGDFRSVQTEVAATWNVRSGFIVFRGSLVIKLKETMA